MTCASWLRGGRSSPAGLLPRGGGGARPLSPLLHLRHAKPFALATLSGDARVRHRWPSTDRPHRRGRRHGVGGQHRRRPARRRARSLQQNTATRRTRRPPPSAAPRGRLHRRRPRPRHLSGRRGRPPPPPARRINGGAAGHPSLSHCIVDTRAPAMDCAACASAASSLSLLPLLLSSPRARRSAAGVAVSWRHGYSTRPTSLYQQHPDVGPPRRHGAADFACRGRVFTVVRRRRELRATSAAVSKALSSASVRAAIARPLNRTAARRFRAPSLESGLKHCGKRDLPWARSEDAKRLIERLFDK